MHAIFEFLVEIVISVIFEGIILEIFNLIKKGSSYLKT